MDVDRFVDIAMLPGEAHMTLYLVLPAAFSVDEAVPVVAGGPLAQHA